MSGRVMQINSASEFSARRLKLMNQVAPTGHPPTISKHDALMVKPVPENPRATHLHGLHCGLMDASGDIESPVDVDWDATV